MSHYLFPLPISITYFHYLFPLLISITYYRLSDVVYGGDCGSSSSSSYHLPRIYIEKSYIYNQVARSIPHTAKFTEDIASETDQRIEEIEKEEKMSPKKKWSKVLSRVQKFVQILIPVVSITFAVLSLVYCN